MDGEAGRGEGRSKTGEGENQETLMRNNVREC